MLLKDRKNMLFSILLITIFENVGCKKFVEISPPTNSITTAQVFLDSANAASAIAGLYGNLINTSDIHFGSGAVTIYCGLSADELVNFSGDSKKVEFQTNKLLATNGLENGFFWNDPYFAIYQANAAIEGISNSTGINQSAMNEFIGEARFIRAFCYFYLVNTFGDVPLVTSTDFKSNALLARAPRGQVYKFIVDELRSVEALLDENTNNERVRASKFAALALLARVYLYTEDWQKAVDAATNVINRADLFSLNPDLNQVFQKNNSESILQWQLNKNVPPFNATPEGYTLIPYNHTTEPSYYLTSQLVESFEVGDKRRIAWVDSTVYNGTTYHYPYKYKIGPLQQVPNSDPEEYYMVLRLAEQYLIRSEAKVRQNDISGAVEDLNVIRMRAGIPVFPLSLTQAQVLAAIEQERKVELFAEWGHRWFDLKRTHRIDSVLGVSKFPNWQTHDQFYPLPQSELQANPHLTQNVGY